MTSDELTKGPCSGVRIIDLSSVVSGPVGTQVLGDLGADVIKVEAPIGDFSRLSGGAPHAGLNGFFAQQNRNKRSLVLDLKVEAGRSVLRDLVAGADVLVENYRPGVADRMGVGWEALRSEQPKLIYVAISGFGATGPYADQPAYDPLIQGLTGFMPVQGGRGEPRMIQTVVADKVGGLTAAVAILAALFERQRSGVGQRVDVPMLDAYAAFVLPDQMAGRTFAALEPTAHDVSSVYRSFETADGHVVGIASQDGQFRALCLALDREDWVEDERFSGIAARFAHLDVFYAGVEVELRKVTTATFIERARRFGAPFAPVLDLEGFLEDEQVVHNETIETHHFDGIGEMRFLRPPLRFERTPAAIHRPPPRLDEHRDEILGTLGYDAAKVAALGEAGAFGSSR